MAGQLAGVFLRFSGKRANEDETTPHAGEFHSMLKQLCDKGRYWCVLLIVTGSVSALGHEGHRPLPTKGVQVDLQTGQLTLSRAAREVLDIKSVEMQSRDVAGSVRAYATVVPPWTQHAYVTSRLPGRIAKLQARPGDVVEAGQVLAELDSLDLHTLRLDYQKAQNELELSGKLLDALTPAAKAGSVAGQRGGEYASAESKHP
jgi:cobalt-zinc-cadmium efflux system membrane fusion protein